MLPKAHSFGLVACFWCGTFCPFWFCSQRAEKKRAGCFPLFVFLPSDCRCFVILHRGAVGGSVSMIVVFPSHTHCYLCINFSLSDKSVVSSLFDLAPFYSALTLLCG